MTQVAGKTLTSIEDFKKLGQIHMAAILEKMADAVGADYSEVNTSDDWYTKHEWTKEEETQFEEWMAAYLKNDRKAFYELIPAYYRFTLKNAKEAARWFVLWYGWKTKIRYY